VAKRTRVARTAPHRPGTRPVGARGAAAAPRRPDATPIGRTVSAPLAPAQPLPSEVQASALVETQGQPGGPILRSTPGRLKVKPNSLLAARAQTEYVYVGQDLRRIVTVGAILFGILLALWIVLVLLGMSGLY
jgi:hypothetical protein